MAKQEAFLEKGPQELLTLRTLLAKEDQVSFKCDRRDSALLLSEIERGARRKHSHSQDRLNPLCTLSLGSWYHSRECFYNVCHVFIFFPQFRSF